MSAGVRAFVVSFARETLGGIGRRWSDGTSPTVPTSLMRGYGLKLCVCFVWRSEEVGY